MVVGPGGSDRVISVADEEDWLDLLIASERVSQWLDILKSGSLEQKRQAAQSLLAGVSAKEAYVEEAKAAGAIGLLTNLLGKIDDDTLLCKAAAIITACSGPQAGGKKVQNIQYGQHVIRIQEGALGDGLGARIWVAAHCLCRHLECSPELVAGLDVLELGSGCGLCGLLAASIGAAKVTLSDYEHSVVLNLRTCVLANLSPHDVKRTEPCARAQSEAQDAAALPTPNRTPVQQDQSSSAERGRPCATPLRADQWDMEDSIAGQGVNSDGPPSLEANEQFPVIIGSDLIYELYHSDMVAAVVSQRLAQHGKAYIALAIRRQEHLDRLLEQAEQVGLDFRVEQQTVDPEAVGIAGRKDEYEGGFVLLTFQFAKSQEGNTLVRSKAASQ